MPALSLRELAETIPGDNSMILSLANINLNAIMQKHIELIASVVCKPGAEILFLSGFLYDIRATIKTTLFDNKLIFNLMNCKKTGYVLKLLILKPRHRDFLVIIH